MKRKMLAMLAASAVLATACGTDADTSTTSPEGGDEAVDLRWRTRPDNQAEADVYAQVSSAIDAANTRLTLQYEPGGSETSSYQDVLKTELAAGTAPDVFWIPGTDIADFAKRGLIKDVRSIADVSTDYAGDAAYYPGPMEFLTHNPETSNSGESLWGLPRDVSTFALYLNMDLIEEAGAEDPRELAATGAWDWDAFRRVGEAVTGLDAQIKGYGMNSWWANYGYWINAAGGNFFNADRTGCGLDTDEAVAGLEFMQGLYQDELAVPFGEDSEPPFLAGQVGMFMNGRWATPGTRSSASFDWDVVKLPDGPGGPSNWLFWGAYVVNANTEHPEAAFELLTELTSPSTQATISELGANIPSRIDDADAQADFLTYSPPANNQAFLDGLGQNPVSEGPLWSGDWPAYDGAMSPEIQSVIAGDQSLADFQASICDKLNPTFG
ncbi:MAG: multiple sugar transport system substrate-binding protein [Glaciecola sp.]|jgi:multiple sugar transport system substrate-binding protein